MSHYNPTNCPGPGDEATWPPYSGHPNDPRAPDEPEWDQLTDAEKVALLCEESKERLAEWHLELLENIRVLIRFARAGSRSPHNSIALEEYIKNNRLD